MSQFLLAQDLRHLPPWLIFDVRQKKTMKLHLRAISSAVLALALSSSLVASVLESPSMLQILAQPEKFDGKEVQIVGFMNLEFEGNALYLHQEDFRHGLGNSIWLSVGPDFPRELNRKYVLIRGTYSAKDRGHMGLFTGTLKNITRCIIRSDPDNPRREKNEK